MKTFEGNTGEYLYDFLAGRAFKKIIQEFPHGSVVRNPTRIPEDRGSIPDLDQWVKDLGLP